MAVSTFLGDQLIGEVMCAPLEHQSSNPSERENSMMTRGQLNDEKHIQRLSFPPNAMNKDDDVYIHNTASTFVFFDGVINSLRFHLVFP